MATSTPDFMTAASQSFLALLANPHLNWYILGILGLIFVEGLLVLRSRSFEKLRRATPNLTLGLGAVGSLLLLMHVLTVAPTNWARAWPVLKTELVVALFPLLWGLVLSVFYRFCCTLFAPASPAATPHRIDVESAKRLMDACQTLSTRMDAVLDNWSTTEQALVRQTNTTLQGIRKDVKTHLQGNGRS